MKVNLDFGSACNFDCPYCYNKLGHDLTTFRRTALTQEQVNLVAEVCAAYGQVDELAVIGGEPTVFAPLTGLINKVKPLLLSVISNGYDVERLRKLTHSPGAVKTSTVITVHRSIYEGLDVDEWLRAWEKLRTPEKEVRYMLMVDGEATPISLFKKVLDVVPEERVGFSYVRRKFSFDPKGLAASTRFMVTKTPWGKKFLQDVNVGEIGCGAKPNLNYGEDCGEAKNQIINFSVNGVKKCGADPYLEPYLGTGESILAKVQEHQFTCNRKWMNDECPLCYTCTKKKE